MSKAHSAYPDEHMEHCHQAPDRNSAELCIQWRATVAAEKAAKANETSNYIAGAGALLSFASIVFVLVALRQTRKANAIAAREYARGRLEARKSQELAQKAILDNREAMALEYSAKLTVKIDAAISEGEERPRPNIPSFVVEIKNVGRTEATNVFIYLGLVPLGLADDPAGLENRVEFRAEGPHNIEQGGFVTAMALTRIPDEDAARIIAREWKLCVVVKITYEDFTGKVHTLVSIGQTFGEHYVNGLPPMHSFKAEWADNG